MDYTETTCFDVMLTQTDFKLNRDIPIRVLPLSNFLPY